MKEEPAEARSLTGEKRSEGEYVQKPDDHFGVKEGKRLNLSTRFPSNPTVTQITSNKTRNLIEICKKTHLDICLNEKINRYIRTAPLFNSWF